MPSELPHPNDPDDAAGDAIRQVRESRPFRLALGRAIRNVFREHPELAPIRVCISIGPAPIYAENTTPVNCVPHPPAAANNRLQPFLPSNLCMEIIP